jgi:uncharacterized membrane protein YheB (UPF0754 family)
MPLHTIRQACLVCLPLLLLTGIITHLYLDLGECSSYLYIISLTANIGYFTNFIAIKMLFKPYQKTALGRQGLIPKNQPKLASALSATINDHFLASEHWQDYTTQADIVPKLLSKSKTYSKNWISQAENAEKLITTLANYLKKNESNLHPLFEQLQSQVIKQISSELDINSLLEQGFNWVEDQFLNHPQKMEFMIEPVIKTVAENIPQIAQRLVETVDQHIENQGTIKRNIAKAAKWSADFSEEDVKQYLFRMVASPEFRATLFQGIQSLVSEYKKRNDKDNTIDDPLLQTFDFNTVIQQFVEQKTKSINIAQLIGSSLQQPNNKAALILYIKSSIDPVFSQLNNWLTQPEIIEEVNSQLVKLIEAIDLREIIEEKARNFSPQKMENIFLSMISDQLVFIELLGAILGGLSGLALIDIRLFAGFSVGLLVLYVSDHWLTVRRDNKIANNKHDVSAFRL